MKTSNYTTDQYEIKNTLLKSFHMVKIKQY